MGGHGGSGWGVLLGIIFCIGLVCGMALTASTVLGFIGGIETVVIHFKYRSSAVGQLYEDITQSHIVEYSRNAMTLSLVFLGEFFLFLVAAVIALIIFFCTHSNLGHTATVFVVVIILAIAAVASIVSVVFSGKQIQEQSSDRCSGYSEKSAEYLSNATEVEISKIERLTGVTDALTPESFKNWVLGFCKKNEGKTKKCFGFLLQFSIVIVVFGLPIIIGVFAILICK
jgi:ABC-type multidrug transport system fused ATPase/permease subunit